MDVYDAISTNVAIRKFLDKKILPNHIYQVLEAGRLSQSGKNLQPWFFVVVRSKKVLNQLADLMVGDIDEVIMRQAPAAIALVCDPSSEFHLTDIARAAQNMTLAAWELGIGSCWISGPEGKMREPYHLKAQELLMIPPNLRFVDILVFGYVEKPPRSSLSKKRKKLADICFEDRFGNPLSR